MIKLPAHKLSQYARKHKYKLPVIWMIGSTFTSIFAIMLLLTTTFSPTDLQNFKYATFVAKPHVLGSATTKVESADAKAARIEAIFAKYNCPIVGYGPKFVAEAEKNAIPYWVVAAVAFQESSCGKQTPTKNGAESNNLWGWGVWGQNVATFESIDEGIEVVSKYMHDKFFSDGVTDLCTIMGTYTPPSNGSWCEGVEFFKDEIVEFERQT